MYLSDEQAPIDKEKLQQCVRDSVALPVCKALNAKHQFAISSHHIVAPMFYSLLRHWLHLYRIAEAMPITKTASLPLTAKR